MTQIQGEYDEPLAAVAQALGDALEAGDAGGSAAAFAAGEPVVDVWGGHADGDRTRGWERDTIVIVFSVTKTMTALCALIPGGPRAVGSGHPGGPVLAGVRGGGQGERAGSARAGAHRGIADWEGRVVELYDWAAAATGLAATTPQWGPGTAVGYHSMTQGLLVGELVRRITGRSIGTSSPRRSPGRSARTSGSAFRPSTTTGWH